MGEILDQKEIDALLEAVEGGEVEVEMPHEERRIGVSTYDFKRPERVSKDQLRSLEALHEVLARNLGASISAFVRTIIEVKLVAVEQLSYSEFIMSLPNPTCFNILKAPPLEGNVILEINPSIIFPIVDRLLGGGKIESRPPERPFTEIEWRLVRTILDRIIEQLRTAWEGVCKAQFEIVESESNPQLMQILAPNELVVLAFFELRMADYFGMLNVCFPFMTLEPVMPSFSAQTWFSYTRASERKADSENLLGNVRYAQVEVDCLLCESTITFKELLQLEPGDVIQTTEPADSPAILRVEGRPKFLAATGKFRNKYAVRILGPVSQRQLT